MFNVELHIEATGDFDIDLQETDVECPRCHFHNPAWVRQIRLRDTIICRGCKANLRLDDSMNTVRKARRGIMESFREVMAQLETSGR